MTPPLMTSALNADRLELVAAGSWTAANVDHLERLVQVAAREAARARSVVIDMARVEQLDTLGAWLLERLARSSKLDGNETQFTGLKPHYRGLIDEMQRVNLQPSPSFQSSSRAIIALDCRHHLNLSPCKRCSERFLPRRKQAVDVRRYVPVVSGR
jgi:anti-anti-sigma regulatory factor